MHIYLSVSLSVSLSYIYKYIYIFLSCDLKLKLSWTSNNEHDWTPVKYLNVLPEIRTQKQLRHFFHTILQKYYQLSILSTFFGTLQTCYFGNFGNAWPSPSKSKHQFVSSFHAYLNVKINFVTHFVLKILRYCKLVSVLWACLATHTQSDTIILQKNLVFICSQKIN